MFKELFKESIKKLVKEFDQFASVSEKIENELKKIDKKAYKQFKDMTEEAYDLAWRTINPVDEVSESREEAKAAYLNPGYSVKDAEKLLKQAKPGTYAYAQYNCKKSRSGICSGEIIDTEKGKVVILNTFDELVEVDPKNITMLDVIKKSEKIV